MQILRKLIVIALLAVFGLPFASSLFALTPQIEASLPACCRRTGKHHCMMNMADRNQATSDKPGFSAPRDKCPSFPAALVVSHHSLDSVAPTGRLIYSGLISHPTGLAQTESKYRISRDRSRQKRGPPTLTIL